MLLPTLDRIRREVGCGMLIVDHDMRLIMGLCDRLHVLNYGRTIAEGTPDEVRRQSRRDRSLSGSGGRGEVMSLLSISDLHVHYGAIQALRGISLEVDEGEIVGSDRCQRCRERARRC